MRTLIRKALISALLTTGTSTHAAEWKIDPTLRFSGGYNDNLRMNIGNKISSAETTFSPGTIFSVATPTSGASGDVRFDFRRFKDNSNLDDNNSRFKISSFHNLERTRLGLNLDFVRDTTLDSQLEETGLALGRVHRQRVNISQNWGYAFDERTSLNASYSYSNVKYKNSGGSAFVNYALNSAQTSLSHVLNERTTTSITLSASRTNSSNDVKSTNTNLQGGASYQLSESLSASLFVGMRRTRTDFSRNSLIPIFSGDLIVGVIPLTQDVSNSGSGYTFSTSFTKAFLRGKTVFTATRNISNSVNGTPIEITRMSLKNLYRLTETLSVALNIDLYKAKSENSVSRRLDRDYYQISPGVNWKFRRFWRISGNYRYRRQTFDNINDDATQNAAYLTLTYQWPRIVVSR